MIEIGIARCVSDEIHLISNDELKVSLSSSGIRLLDGSVITTLIDVDDKDYEIVFKYRERRLITQFLIQAILSLIPNWVIPSYYCRNVIQLCAKSALNPQQEIIYKLNHLQKFSRKPFEIRFVVEWINRAYFVDPLRFSRTSTTEMAFDKFRRERRFNTDMADWICELVNSELKA